MLSAATLVASEYPWSIPPWFLYNFLSNMGFITKCERFPHADEARGGAPTAFLHVLPFPSQGVEFRKCACLPAVWCDALWQAETSLGATCPPLPAHANKLLPINLSIPPTTISLCRFSDARLRTQPLTTGAHWPTGDASPESASFWAAETKGWGEGHWWGMWKRRIIIRGTGVGAPVAWFYFVSSPTKFSEWDQREGKTAKCKEGSSTDEMVL